MKIAIVHDLAEVVVGDITPADNVPAKLKKEMEMNALKDMLKEFDEKFQNEIVSLFKEYEEGTSVEAQIVRDLDKYEMMLMAFQYE